MQMGDTAPEPKKGGRKVHPLSNFLPKRGGRTFRKGKKLLVSPSAAANVISDPKEGGLNRFKTKKEGGGAHSGFSP